MDDLVTPYRFLVVVYTVFIGGLATGVLLAMAW